MLYEANSKRHLPHVTTRFVELLGLATLLPDSRDAQTDCADDLVVLTGIPFDQGTSGGAVIDKQSGKILDATQGTLNQTMPDSGIGNPDTFKPIACIPSLAADISGED